MMNLVDRSWFKTLYQLSYYKIHFRVKRPRRAKALGNRTLSITYNG